MRILAELTIAGVLIGALYGLVAVSLTLMVRSSGVLSFAHAGFALLSAYTYAGLQCPKGGVTSQCGAEAVLPPVPAALVAIAAAVGAALATERLIVRPLERADQATKVMATGAVLALISGVLLQAYGSQAPTIPDRKQLLPGGGVVVANIFLSSQRLWIFGIAMTLVVVLAVVLRRSWFGLGVRAAGQLPEIAVLMGVSQTAVSRFNWALGGALAGIAGVLIGPVTVVNVGTFSFLLIKAVGATLVGGLVSLPLTFVGGLGIGVVETALPHYWATQGAANVGIAALVLGTLALRRGRIATLGYSGPVADSGRRGRLALGVARCIVSLRAILRPVPRPVWLVLAAAVLATGPLRTGYYATVGNSGLYYAFIALSLVVITGTTGQVSFMQAGFAAVGAFGMATSLDRGLSVPAALAVTVLVSTAIGGIAGLLMGRFRGLEFAIVSLALTSVLSEFVVTRGGVATSIEAPSIFGQSLLEARNLFVLMFVLFAVSLWLVRNLRSTALGQTFSAMREMHDRVGHFGVNPVKAEAALLAFSSGLASLAGATFALTVLTSLAPVFFVPLLSVTMVLVAVVGGIGTLSGAVVAGVIFGPGQELLTRLLSTQSANALPQITSAVLALVFIVRAPKGIAALAGWADQTLKQQPLGVSARRFRGLPVAPARESADSVPGPGVASGVTG